MLSKISCQWLLVGLAAVVLAQGMVVMRHISIAITEEQGASREEIEEFQMKADKLLSEVAQARYDVQQLRNDLLKVGGKDAD